MKLLYTFFALLIHIQLFAQCTAPTNDITTYSIFAGQESVSTSIIDEISGITYNDVTGEFLIVSDDGKLARRNPSSGNWSAISINDWSGNNCKTNKFGDIEAITYMGQVNSNTHRYAIAEERERFITFVNISDNQTSLDFPNKSFLKFSGISVSEPSCGANDGIEGIAYDQSNNTMYFSKERNAAEIYKFSVPNTISGQTITPTPLVNLTTLGMSIYAIHGLDVFDNGNLLILAALQGPSNVDPGLYNRIMLEFDPCGNLLSSMNVEPTINDSAELEGIVVNQNRVCLIGEFGVMYHLEQNPLASTCPDLSINFAGVLNQSGSVVTVSNASTRNIGNQTAGTYTVLACLSSDLNITASDMTLGVVATITNHAVSSNELFSFSFDLSTLSVTSGQYFVGYLVDWTDDVSECDETNNRGVLTSSRVDLSQAPTCEITMDIHDNPVSPGLYETRQTIYSAGLVATSTPVEFSAGDMIELQSGFEATANSNFNAYIAGCN